MNRSSILKKISNLLILLFLMAFTQLHAQVYPVNVFVKMVPPYSVRLSEYTTSISERMYVDLTLLDVNDINRKVKLKLIIKRQNQVIATSRDFVSGAPNITLDGGLPLTLTNIDLAPYFRFENLVGISPQLYNNPLPDGYFEFCFEVYDFNTGRRFSKPGCDNIHLVQYDPPMLNLPREGDIVSAELPQNIFFTWTPRATPPTGVEYEFTIKELWDTGIDPRAAFQTGPPLYQTKTFDRSFLYDQIAPQLIDGKTYGWQVRASASDGIEETALFKNNGYSEIFWFTYLSDCNPPEFILTEAISTSSERITWNPNFDHLAYRVQYRKVAYKQETEKEKQRREKRNEKRAEKGKDPIDFDPEREAYEWYEVNTRNPNATIHNLEASTTYEYRVGGQCMLNGGYSYSEPGEFTTATKGENNYYNCGLLPEVHITNRDPLQNLGVNETFTAGDFPVTIKEVRGENGTYSGWGFIVVPYLADTKIRVVFNDIQINTDYQLIQGEVETAYDKDWKNVYDQQEVVDAVKEIPDHIGDLAGIISDLFKKREEELKKLRQLQDALANGTITKEEFDKGAEQRGINIKAIDEQLNGTVTDKIINSPYATEEEKKEAKYLELSQSLVSIDTDVKKELANQKVVRERLDKIASAIDERAQEEEEILYPDGGYFEKLLQQIRCAYASGLNEIEMPEKYRNGGTKKDIAFNYGIAVDKSSINGEKTTRGWWTATANATRITNIKNPEIDPSKGTISFGNFKIEVPVSSYNWNGGISPFEHFKNYLLPDNQTIENDFNAVWNGSISRKINTNQKLSSDDVDQLKKIASCGTHMLNTSIRYKLIKALLNVGLWTSEKEEDLVLDILASTPKGHKAKDLFEKLNSDYSLMNDLMRSLDDYGGNEKNFIRLSKEIFSLFDRAYSIEEKESIYNNLNENRKLYFYGFNDFIICEWKINVSRDKNLINFKETNVYNVRYDNYNPYVPGSGLPKCDQEIEEYTLKVNDFVAVNYVTNEDRVDFGEGTHLMPAIVYYILIKSHKNETLRTQFDTFIFVLGILTPIDEFYLLGKALKYGNRGLKAVRYSTIKTLAKSERIEVSLTANGEKLKEISNGRVDKYVKFVDEVKGVENLFDISTIKNLPEIIPTGEKLTNISFNKFTKGFDADFIASLGTKYADDLAKIKNGLDKGGNLTEGIVAEVLRKQGYTVTKDIGKYGSNNGFDVVAYKGSLDNPTEIMIIEGKQFRQNKILDEFDGIANQTGYDPASGLTINPANPKTRLPTQMSMDWTFEHVAVKLEHLGGNKTKLASTLNNNKSKVERYVFAIDKSDGTGYFAKLSNNFKK